jgi:hypothetical protein
MFGLNWPNFTKVRSVWRKKIFCKNLFSYFGQKFVEILLSILGKRKGSVMNFNLDEFMQATTY